MRYRISDPDEYLAITGMGIRSVHITKAAWVWPFQRCKRFSVQPHDYAMDLQAMTKEKLQFSLPVVFTVSPDVNRRGANAPGGAVDAGTKGSDGTHGGYIRSNGNNHSRGNGHGGGNQAAASLDDVEDRGDSLVKYAMLLATAGHLQQGGKAALAGSKDETAHVANIAKGIIEGETRVLVSSMTMEEIFTERDVFKRRIFRNIQSELDQFGLKIYNANVKELKDAPGSVYFESLSRKAHEGATNQARIDVADAQLRGTVGEAQRRGQQDREIAKINAETAVQKTDRDIERAQAEAKLNTTQAGLDRDVHIARVSAERALESRDEDLKRDVKLKRAAAELERLRALDVVAATAARESRQQAVDAGAYQVRADADAAAYAAEKASDAAASGKQKDAEALACMADAYAKLANAFGGPQGLLQYLMIEKSTYVELARANADAIRGLDRAQDYDGLDAMRNVYQMLPPLMTTIHDQTGITLPEWQFGRMNAQMKAIDDDSGAAAPKVNGVNRTDS
ncbi:SPFH domain/band 7 family protein [Hirsutella rhossiliensis]|uniref:SPFH domain/band 7 family protein n=1 Tax=Hirsutella rhossiliensis TaxID=111463 RepID=A0A9P8N3N5_9HYPO|nr:SPFH domain/band 7 family protein [Hirsutella rhossiliensis]KAH0966234.1 SPFH domain/band 7 family protein [Hirsutella rhossiliensis]